MSTSEQLITAPLEEQPRRRRQLLSGVIYLLFAAAAVFVVLPQFLGEDKDKIWPVLHSARPEWLALALAFEAVRYFCFGLVARQIAKMLGQPLRRRDTTQMMLASYALSRIFSLGGATAFLVRLQFFTRRGFSVGRTIGLFITHNVVSGVALFLTYLFGVSVLWLRGELDGYKILAALGWLVVIFAAAGAQVYLGMHPRLLEHVAAWGLKRFDRRFRQLFNRALYQPEPLLKLTRDLADSVNMTFRHRRGLLQAFGWQAAGLASDIISLIVAFQALQVPMEPALIVAAYILAYYAQLIAPTPGEAGAMEFGLVIVLIALGLSPLHAATTTLLFRFISFWLPIPFGVIAYFNLKRQGKV